jgi:hypothetical protein
MRSPTRRTFNRHALIRDNTPPEPSSDSPAELGNSVDYLNVAQLVADGLIPLPLDLPHHELLKVFARVQEIRRHSLTRHIARCIALRITHTSLGDRK